MSKGTKKSERLEERREESAVNCLAHLCTVAVLEDGGCAGSRSRRGCLHPFPISRGWPEWQVPPWVSLPVRELAAVRGLQGSWTKSMRSFRLECVFTFATISEAVPGTENKHKGARAPPSKASRVRSPAGSPDFCKWESCRTMPLVGGFSRGSPVSPPFHTGTAPYSPQSSSSAHKTSLLRAALISSLPLNLLIDNYVGLEKGKFVPLPEGDILGRIVDSGDVTPLSGACWPHPARLLVGDGASEGECVWLQQRARAIAGILEPIDTRAAAMQPGKLWSNAAGRVIFSSSIPGRTPSIIFILGRRVLLSPPRGCEKHRVVVRKVCGGGGRVKAPARVHTGRVGVDCVSGHAPLNYPRRWKSFRTMPTRHVCRFYCSSYVVKVENCISRSNHEIFAASQKLGFYSHVTGQGDAKGCCVGVTQRVDSCPVAPSWYETRSEIASKIYTENCCIIRVQSWAGDRDEVHFEPSKLAVRNLDLRSAAIVDKCRSFDLGSGKMLVQPGIRVHKLIHVKRTGCDASHSGALVRLLTSHQGGPGESNSQPRGSQTDLYALATRLQRCYTKPQGSRLRNPSKHTDIDYSRLLSSHQGEPGSIPGRVNPGFSQVGIVPYDAAGRWVFSGSSRFPRSWIAVLLHSRIISLSSAFNNSLLLPRHQVYRIREIIMEVKGNSRQNGVTCQLCAARGKSPTNSRDPSDAIKQTSAARQHYSRACWCQISGHVAQLARVRVYVCVWQGRGASLPPVAPMHTSAARGHTTRDAACYRLARWSVRGGRRAPDEPSTAPLQQACTEVVGPPYPRFATEQAAVQRPSDVAWCALPPVDLQLCSTRCVSFMTHPAAGATVAERLACSPPNKAIRVQSSAGSLRIFAFYRSPPPHSRRKKEASGIKWRRVRHTAAATLIEKKENLGARGLPSSWRLFYWAGSCKSCRRSWRAHMDPVPLPNTSRNNHKVQEKAETRYTQSGDIIPSMYMPAVTGDE
ncbi:hypothetical protein PR048_016864 [Dryococelus australis]|uniref:Uncharacterized protein n=1 Tax=Dryococelus australis TaxID=614101 RepID=A0ABQ9H7V9_9NEOP|nr:hypothetical protein PR048_016864 [Dryococelus australis]